MALDLPCYPKKHKLPTIPCAGPNDKRRYVIGLDLGQAQDFTALAIIQQPPAIRETEEPEEIIYLLRHLQRFPLGTPYTEIVPAVAEIAKNPELGYSTLVVDQTGVGRALVDMLKKEKMPSRLIPVTITTGQTITKTEENFWHVPKKELVTDLQVLLQSRRLKIARDLPDADILVREMENFKVKITAAANEVFGAWREGQHDDLVLAVALACWWAESHPPWPPNPFGFGKSEVAKMIEKGW